MSEFPKSEAEIRELAERMISGLQENPYFPSPPHSSSDLRNALDAYLLKSNNQMALQAAAQQGTKEKREALGVVKIYMRGDLKYAENEAENDDTKLATIGWSSRAPNTPLAAPGQTQAVIVSRQEGGDVDVSWKAPRTGGTVACYRIEKRDLAEGALWRIAGMSVTTQATLTNQERGKEMEYRVIAVNRAGEGLPSNNVLVVL
jgi:hypothetical protein